MLSTRAVSSGKESNVHLRSCKYWYILLRHMPFKGNTAFVSEGGPNAWLRMRPLNFSWRCATELCVSSQIPIASIGILILLYCIVTFYEKRFKKSLIICEDLCAWITFLVFFPRFLTPPVLKALIALVSCPEPDHPLRADLAEEYSKDRAKFMKNAEEYTKKHSEKRPVEWWHNTDAHSCLLSFWFLLKEPLSAPSPVYI